MNESARDFQKVALGRSDGIFNHSALPDRFRRLIGTEVPSRTESDRALCFLGKPDRFAVVILQVRFLAVYIAEYPPLFSPF